MKLKSVYTRIVESAAASALALILLNVCSASAAIVSYTNEANWNAAVGYYVVEPFDSTGPKSFTGVNTSVGVIGGARGVLTGSVWLDKMVDEGTQSTTFRYKPGPLIGAGATFDSTPGGTGNGLLLTLNLVGGGTAVVGQIGPITGFFGFVSSDPFDSFLITNGTSAGVAETFDMDNLKFAPVPTPATIALLGLGLIGVGAARRKQD
jgi:hypothetical protein